MALSQLAGAIRTSSELRGEGAHTAPGSKEDMREDNVNYTFDSKSKVILTIL
jgi:hypothetical protein